MNVRKSLNKILKGNSYSNQHVFLRLSPLGYLLVPSHQVLELFPEWVCLVQQWRRISYYAAINVGSGDGVGALSLIMGHDDNIG